MSSFNQRKTFSMKSSTFQIFFKILAFDRSKLNIFKYWPKIVIFWFKMFFSLSWYLIWYKDIRTLRLKTISWTGAKYSFFHFDWKPAPVSSRITIYLKMFSEALTIRKMKRKFLRSTSGQKLRFYEHFCQKIFSFLIFPKPTNFLGFSLAWSCQKFRSLAFFSLAWNWLGLILAWLANFE